MPEQRLGFRKTPWSVFIVHELTAAAEHQSIIPVLVLPAHAAAACKQQHHQHCLLCMRSFASTGITIHSRSLLKNALQLHMHMRMFGDTTLDPRNLLRSVVKLQPSAQRENRSRMYDGRRPTFFRFLSFACMLNIIMLHSMRCTRKTTAFLLDAPAPFFSFLYLPVPPKDFFEKGALNCL